MMDRAGDQRWMHRALRLATRSCGATWPNPGVGCVLVAPDGRLIGEGRHRRCGAAHAEVAALEACRAAGYDPAGATAYVTLAPCTTAGRTPACSDALIRAGIVRVVAAIGDPSQDETGSVFAAAGIAYEEGCCAPLAEQLHGGFLIRVAHGRPRFTGKWAMTIDGCIAAHTGASQWISHADALLLSRRRRRAFDALLVGVGTLIRDDPQLLSRLTDGRTPLRIVVVGEATVPLTSRLVSAAASYPVLVVHDRRASEERLEALHAASVRTLAVHDAHDPVAVGAALGEYGLNDVLVEGGARVHGAYLDAGIYDRLECYIAARSIAGGMGVAGLNGVATIAEGTAWQLEQRPVVLGDTIVCRYRRKRDQEVG
ncbi:MAG: bifunctional diaminohydroxyphosphoribosylaminopyrimidine deaminase/5-amino-6-(5-phosphoribosylamino)uracil reductase RibD [Planctomycetota bacterium]